MTGGYAGHIPKPARGQTQKRRVLFGPLIGQVHECGRDQMRHVTDDGNNVVVT